MQYNYRLKMADVDGSFRFSSVILYNGAMDYIAYLTVGADKLKGHNTNLQIMAHDRPRRMAEGGFSIEVSTKTG